VKNAGRRGFARSWLSSAIRRFSHDLPKPWMS
jgi:hypothetical protein